MNPEGIKWDRERQIMYDFTYMWNLKKQNKWTNISKQTGGCQRGGGLGTAWNRWGELRGTNLQLQNKWVTGMKCTAWGI